MRSNNKSPFSLSLSLQRAKTTFLPKNILLILSVSDTISVVNGCNAAAVISRDKKHGILNHAPENLIAYFDIYTKKKSFMNWSIIDYVSFWRLHARKNWKSSFNPRQISGRTCVWVPSPPFLKGDKERKKIFSPKTSSLRLIWFQRSFRFSNFVCTYENVV